MIPRIAVITVVMIAASRSRWYAIVASCAGGSAPGQVAPATGGGPDAQP